MTFLDVHIDVFLKHVFELLVDYLDLFGRFFLKFAASHFLKSFQVHLIVFRLEEILDVRQTQHHNLIRKPFFVLKPLAAAVSWLNSLSLFNFVLNNQFFVWLDIKFKTNYLELLFELVFTFFLIVLIFLNEVFLEPSLQERMTRV